MNISEALQLNRINASLKSKTKKELLNEVLDLFKNDDAVKNLAAVRKAVLDREEIMSTGVGEGFAIPHGKTNSVEGIIAAFGRTVEPVDFDSLDNKPVRLIFVLVGRENLVGPHIKLLSRISRMMNKAEFREKLLQAKDNQEIYDLFKKEEEKDINLS